MHALFHSILTLAHIHIHIHMHMHIQHAHTDVYMHAHFLFRFMFFMYCCTAQVIQFQIWRLFIHECTEKHTNKRADVFLLKYEKSLDTLEYSQTHTCTEIRVYETATSHHITGKNRTIKWWKKNPHTITCMHMLACASFTIRFCISFVLYVVIIIVILITIMNEKKLDA